MASTDFIDENRKKFWNAKREELKPLIDPSSGIIMEKYLKKACCCVCSPAKPTASHVFTKDSFQIVKCNKCGLLYVLNQLREDIVREYYFESKSMDYWMEVQLGEKEQAWNEKAKYGPGLNMLDKLATGKGKLLDIGCSVGQFLSLAAVRGWDVEGIELNQKAARYCRDKFKFEVKDKLLEDIAYDDGSFDCITLWGVLEHLPDPNGMLKEIYRIMKPSGKLLAFVPNANSLIMRITQAQNSTVSGREHLWYFSPRTIQMLFEKNLLEISKSFSVLPQLHEIMHYLSYNALYQNSDFEGQEEFFLPDDLYTRLERYILHNNMGYKLIAIGTKI